MTDLNTVAVVEDGPKPQSENRSFYGGNKEQDGPKANVTTKNLALNKNLK